MIKCPNCQATLPDFAPACQFCGRALATGQQPGGPPVRRDGFSAGRAPAWVWTAYYAVAAYWVFDGLRLLLTVFRALPKLAALGVVGAGLGPLGIIFGVGLTAIGVGLLLRLEFARGIVNIVCFVNMAGSALGAVQDFLIGGVYGSIGLLMCALEFGLAAFMMFLLGETDRAAPNL